MEKFVSDPSDPDAPFGRKADGSPRKRRPGPGRTPLHRSDIERFNYRRAYQAKWRAANRASEATRLRQWRAAQTLAATAARQLQVLRGGAIGPLRVAPIAEVGILGLALTYYKTNVDSARLYALIEATRITIFEARREVRQRRRNEGPHGAWRRDMAELKRGHTLLIDEVNRRSLSLPGQFGDSQHAKPCNQKP